MPGRVLRTFFSVRPIRRWRIGARPRRLARPLRSAWRCSRRRCRLGVGSGFWESCVARLPGAPAHPDRGSRTLCVQPWQAQCRRAHQRATRSGMLRLPSRQSTNSGRTGLPRSPERERGDGGWCREQAWWIVVPKPLAPAWVFLMGSAKRARRYPCPGACIQRAECRFSTCVVTTQVENLCYGMRRGSGTG